MRSLLVLLALLSSMVQAARSHPDTVPRVQIEDQRRVYRPQEQWYPPSYEERQATQEETNQRLLDLLQQLMEDNQ